MRSTTSALALTAVVSAQQRPQAGPVIRSGGPVYEVVGLDFPTPMDTELEAVFEMRDAPADPSCANQQLGTMARYLNMHARADRGARRAPVAHRAPEANCGALTGGQ